MDSPSYDFSIRDLGERTISSPVAVSYYTPDSKRILHDIYVEHYKDLTVGGGTPLSIEAAGPREKIFFDPEQTKAAIVTCGGLCPGINDVTKAIFMELFYRYGVKNVVGIKYGFQGLVQKYGHQVLELTPDIVKDIHTSGGSILSSSRGMQDPGEMVNTLKRMNVDILFCIGGDGTMRGARAITEEITKRRLNISVIGTPKAIDNDLNLIQKTFGFDTAISEAVKAIQCAHAEAKGAPVGIGLVKIMGCQSGHIAAGAALAQGDVNFVLIPEVPS
jgi:6-phosphofructokinase 1